MKGAYFLKDIVRGSPEYECHLFSKQASAQARSFLSRLPGYKPTPLLDLSSESRKFGVGRLYYKDEAQRFEVGSFKALGGAYGVYRAIERLANAEGFENLHVDDILDGRVRHLTKSLTVVCATDGNYGRAVAWAAKLLGCRSRVYVNAATSTNRADAILQYGADVVRVSGVYEDALEQAEYDARLHGWTMVSDTAYDGCNDSPEDVMAGYATLVHEIGQQWDADVPPTHVFLQVGVGGLAASVIAQCLRIWTARPPTFIVVEPVEADCAFQSGMAGVSTSAAGNLKTLSVGLACGRLSTQAWPVLRDNVSAYMLIDDSDVTAAMRLLSRCESGGVVAGESGCAGFAAFRRACLYEPLKQALGLGENSHVLTIGTEGATDAEIYRSIVFGTARS